MLLITFTIVINKNNIRDDPIELHANNVTDVVHYISHVHHSSRINQVNLKPISMPEAAT